MELHQLQYIAEVAAQKNFTRAADSINVSQSTLSHQIAKLEDELGVKLFERKPRSVSLTQAGEEFLTHVQLSLNNLESAKQSIQDYRGLLKGTLRIGTIASLGEINLALMLAEFYREHSGLTFQIVQAGAYELLEKLYAGEIEIAFVVMPPPNQYEDMEFCLLTQDDYVLALPPDHRLAGRKSLDLSEVADENFIFHPASDRMFSICMEACSKAGFKPRIVCESSHSPTCLALISAGMGIGFFPKEKLDSSSFAIATAPLNQPLKKDIALARRKHPASTPACQKFHRFALDWTATKV